MDGSMLVVMIRRGGCNTQKYPHRDFGGINERCEDRQLVRITNSAFSIFPKIFIARYHLLHEISLSSS